MQNGAETVELKIEEVQVYNSVFQKFHLADVYVKKGKIYYVDFKREESPKLQAEKTIDGRAKYMVPGLVDAHMHIESSMLTPSSMGKRLAECGVTTVISEPHEIANVNGIAGICDMMKAGENAPVDIFYGIPSCVPSTNPALETTGGVLDFEKMKSLLHHPKVACVGEIMNYRQVIRENNLEISKLLAYLAEKEPSYIIEGHCPSLVNLDLAKFLYLGINSDHTEHNLEELKQRFMNGMYVEIQSKMLKKEVIEFIEENNLYGHFGFVTDDVMADTLMDEGHLDAVVRKAVKLGMSPEKVIYHATYTNANRMNLKDRNMIAPGKLADFILLSDLENFTIASVYKKGSCIYEKEQAEAEFDVELKSEMQTEADVELKSEKQAEAEFDAEFKSEKLTEADIDAEMKEKMDVEADASCAFDDSYAHMIKVAPVDESKFTLLMNGKAADKSKFTLMMNGKAADETAESVEVNVMKIVDGTTQTIPVKVALPVKDGEIMWENSPVLLAVVFERYGKSGRNCEEAGSAAEAGGSCEEVGSAEEAGRNCEEMGSAAEAGRNFGETGIGYGFVMGNCITHGAVATTYAHDHHNLLAVGGTKKELVQAVNRIIGMGGGMCVYEGDRCLADLKLNIGGIISDAPASEVGGNLKNIRKALRYLGYRHYNEIMSLCTLSLLASPALKISDKGMIDVKQGKIVPLVAEAVHAEKAEL